MPNYCTQSRLDSCVPAAIINAAKWGGINYTKKDHYEQLCNSLIKDGGVETAKLNVYINKFLGDKILIEEKSSLSLISAMKHIIVDQGSIMLTFVVHKAKYKKQMLTHCIFISGIDQQGRWIAHNVHFKGYAGRISYIKDHHMKEIFNRTRKMFYLYKKS